jgi:two-component system chemotaxis response regulator CheY
MNPKTHGVAVTPPAERERLSALIIDDESHVRTFLRTVLHSLGLKQVHESFNGADGVALFQGVRPSLVLLDVNMPVLTGTEAIRQILSADPEAVVIMVTSDGRHETVQEFLELGASGYVLKYRAANSVRAELDALFSSFEIVDDADAA